MQLSRAWPPRDRSRIGRREPRFIDTDRDDWPRMGHLVVVNRPEFWNQLQSARLDIKIETVDQAIYRATKRDCGTHEEGGIIYMSSQVTPDRALA
jgi:hypothetical protein